MIHLHNTAPAACRTCGHFERREIHDGDTVEHDDGCLKHKPLHEPCAGHTDGALMRVDGNRTART